MGPALQRRETLLFVALASRLFLGTFLGRVVRLRVLKVAAVGLVLRLRVAIHALGSPAIVKPIDRFLDAVAFAIIQRVKHHVIQHGRAGFARQLRELVARGAVTAARHAVTADLSE